MVQESMKEVDVEHRSTVEEDGSSKLIVTRYNTMKKNYKVRATKRKDVQNKAHSHEGKQGWDQNTTNPPWHFII